MKNLKVKIFLENYVLPCISKINSWMKHDNKKILFYINSDFRENNKALFDYMIKKGVNRKYQIIVACRDYKRYKEHKIENVKFIGTSKATFEFFHSGIVFYSIGKIPLLPAKDQTVMQMWHGVPLKAADEGLKKQYSLKHQYYTWVLSPSDFLKPIICQWLSVTEDHIYIGGYPRCDIFFNKKENNFNSGNDKLILWVPTFRKSKTRGYTDVDMCGNIVPVLSNNMFVKINEFLKKKRVKIIVKLHPAQDLSDYSLTEFDHFVLLSHDEFEKRGYDLYFLASQSDALITDYSSIYFDYMLTDRPIGFTINDMEEYKRNRGFSLPPEKFMPGSKIKGYEDLLNFVQDVVDDKDPYKEERNEVNKLINQDPTGGYCQKILDFVGIK